MEWNNFHVGFWHPFGNHGGESRDDILRRKSREIAANGWTLWSFKFRNTISDWLRYLPPASSLSPVYAICSDSEGAAIDPKGEVAYSSHYRYPTNQLWKEIPAAVAIPHPFGERNRAPAFIVKRVLFPLQSRNANFRVEWYSATDKAWKKDGIEKYGNGLPTRTEILVRKGGNTRLRKAYAILELGYPYIAELRR